MMYDPNPNNLLHTTGAARSNIVIGAKMLSKLLKESGAMQVLVDYCKAKYGGDMDMPHCADRIVHAGGFITAQMERLENTDMLEVYPVYVPDPPRQPAVVVEGRTLLGFSDLSDLAEDFFNIRITTP
jgi:hypothetical protein